MLLSRYCFEFGRENVLGYFGCWPGSYSMTQHIKVLKEESTILIFVRKQFYFFRYIVVYIILLIVFSYQWDINDKFDLKWDFLLVTE